MLDIIIIIIMSNNFSTQDIIMFEKPLPVVIQKIIEQYACEHPLVSVIKTGYVFIIDSIHYQISNTARFYYQCSCDESGLTDDDDINTDSYYEPPYEDLLLLRNTKKSVFYL